MCARGRVDKKIIAVIIVAILLVAGVAVAVLAMNGGGDEKQKATLTNRLTVLGNAFADDTIDDKDTQVIQAYLDGKKTVTVAGNEISLTDSNVLAFCDADNNGTINSADLEFVKTLISGKANLLYYVNAKSEIASASLPVNNLIIMFRRIGTTVAMLGASDMVVGYEDNMKAGGSYGFLNFPGEAVGSQSDPDDEKILTMNNKYASTGGVTIIADATGADPNMEKDLRGINIIRLPVTEMGKSENGVVTLGYILSYNTTIASKVKDNLNKWIDWNDSAKDKINDALEKRTGPKKTSLIGLLYTGTYNIRSTGVSEFEYTEMCGSNNIADDKGLKPNANTTMSELNEILLTYQPDYLLVMHGEGNLLKNTENMNVGYQNFVKEISDNYNGDIVMLSQFVATGPGYALSLMVYANLFLPLEEKFDIQKEYKFFMETLMGKSDLAALPVAVGA